MVEGGLFTNRGKSIPLKSVSISADIKGYVLGLRATMKYLNDDKDPVEVVFKLPLESTQAVVGLRAHMDGKWIRADIQEKEQAKANYDDAIASGLTAAYGEKKTDDVFSIALGNLPGGEEAEIELQMVEELLIDAEEKIRFSLPTTFKPRYTPQGTTDPLATSSDDGATKGKMKGFQEFILHVFNGESIADISSPTHAVTVTPAAEGDILDVKLEEGVDLTTDLVIQISHKTPHTPMVVVENGLKKSDGAKPLTFLNQAALMVNFFPEIPQVDVSCELIFLVDRSGSMSGGFIKSASETLVLFLKSMPEGSYFNIYGFGSSFESLFPKSVLYDQDTLAKATTHAQNLKADLGGTEILPPLREIFRQPEIKGITRQIFLLTDGAVSNTDSCVSEVKKNSHKARCFTFGIGSGASSSLVNGMAKAGNGTAEFVKVGERLQPKVIRSLKHALQPAVTDVKLAFTTSTNNKVIVSPKNFPPLFSGDKTVIYGIIENDNPLTGNVKLTGSLLGGEIVHSLSFEVKGNSSDYNSTLLPIHRLAAKHFLEDMQKENKSSSDIVKLSIEAHVISNETAFIAINEDTTKVVTGAMKTYDVDLLEDEEQLSSKVGAIRLAMQSNIDKAVDRGETLDSLMAQSDMLSAQSNMFYQPAKKTSGGWLSGIGMIGSSIAGWFRGSDNTKRNTAPALNSSSRPVATKGISVDRSRDNSGIDECMDDLSIALEIGNSLESSSSDDKELEERLKKLTSEDEPTIPDLPKLKPSASPAAVDSGTIILLQQANGSWTMDQSFSAAVGIPLTAMESSLPDNCDKTVWATVIAIVVLKVKFFSQKDEWDLVVSKAKSWLMKESRVSSEAQLQELMNTAEIVVSGK